MHSNHHGYSLPHDFTVAFRSSYPAATTDAAGRRGPFGRRAVVGAGLTGLITAVLLARAGKTVLVLEAHSPGMGATGNTTAKISVLQGTKLSKIVGKHGPKVARDYVQGNREGQEWLIQHCEAHGLSVQREDAYTYAQSETGVPSAWPEYETCKAAGLEAEWVDDADVPFPLYGGVRLAQQAQFDPMPLLDSLIVELDERGGRLVQGVRVQKVSSEGDGLALHARTADGDEFDFHANQCVLATGIPILSALRRHRQLERCRPIMGVPAARVALRARRHPSLEGPATRDLTAAH